MEPVTIQIPKTIEEVKTRLGSIERLLTAKGWERAAIVYAFTFEPGSPGRVSDASRNRDQVTASEFALLGIHGIQHKQTVYDYRRAWEMAVQEGQASPVKPGDDVILPMMSYPKVEVRNQQYKGILPSATVEESVATVRKLIERPEVAERVENDFIQKAGRDPRLAARIDRVYEEHHPVPEPRERTFGDMERQRLFGFGVAIYSAIQREQDRVAGLLGYLESHGVDERDREAVDRLIESLSKSRQLLVDIEDRVNKAAGNDYDEVFRRLVNG